jgi:hypothetical protein
MSVDPFIERTGEFIRQLNGAAISDPFVREETQALRGRRLAAPDAHVHDSVVA